jgi:hypothetical protein
MRASVAPPPSASPAHPSPALLRGPLFGGYTVVAVVAAWLVGIALRASDSLSPRIAPWTWLALSGACAMLATLAALLAPRRVGALYVILRLLLMGAMLGAFLALGAARTAWSDPAADPTSVARYANGSSVRLRGEVISEPDLRDGARLLTIEASSIRVGDNGSTQPVSGRITTAYYGPDDWFAPGYGNTRSLSGDLVSLNGRYAPPGVVAELTKGRSVIGDREGDNPLLARLFELRLALAQAIQRALPEPEAALLIGILLGLKNSRIALASGALHRDRHDPPRCSCWPQGLDTRRRGDARLPSVRALAARGRIAARGRRLRRRRRWRSSRVARRDHGRSARAGLGVGPLLQHLYRTCARRPRHERRRNSRQLMNLAAKFPLGC